jgi:hypothetical protein
MIAAICNTLTAALRRVASVRGWARRVVQDTVNCVNCVTFLAIGAPGFAHSAFITGVLGFASPVFLIGVLGFASPAAARDSLGVFETWGAFRDPGVPRCYAIARSERRGGPTGFATVGIWPRAKVRGQIHFRLSRAVAAGARIELRIGGQTMPLVGGGADAWAPDQRGDAAVIAAMRSAERMTLRVRTARGDGFADSYLLAGAATAMDAALVGCAGG